MRSWREPTPALYSGHSSQDAAILLPPQPRVRQAWCPPLGIPSKTTTWCNDQQIPPKLSAANAAEVMKLARQHPIWSWVKQDVCPARLVVRRESFTRIGVNVKGERTALHLTSRTIRAFSTIQRSTLWVKDTLLGHELRSSPLKLASLHLDHSQR